MESFFKTLKVKLPIALGLKPGLKARIETFKYIEVFYNRTRLHSTLGYKLKRNLREHIKIQ